MRKRRVLCVTAAASSDLSGGLSSALVSKVMEVAVRSGEVITLSNSSREQDDVL